MAALLKLTFRGLIDSIPWAVNTWWAPVEPLVALDEAEQAQALAIAASVKWGSDVAFIQHNLVSTNRVIVQGYDVPDCFHDSPLTIVGERGDDMYTAFAAYGFRQYKGNSDFRSSTHRVPGLREPNVVNGSFVTDTEVNATNILEAAQFFSQNLVYDEFAITYEFEPVLIRTQYTPRGIPDPITTIFDPPQQSRVVGALMYGVTSQVSRKRINPA